MILTRKSVMKKILGKSSYPNGTQMDSSKMLGMSGYKDNQFLREVGIGLWELPIPKPKILGFGFGYLLGYKTLIASIRVGEYYSQRLRESIE